MPTVKVSDAYGITVELTATESSITDLGKQALELFNSATTEARKGSHGPAFGFSNERRSTFMAGYGTEWHQPRELQ